MDLHQSDRFTAATVGTRREQMIFRYVMYIYKCGVCILAPVEWEKLLWRFVGDGPFVVIKDEKMKTIAEFD